MKGERKMEVGEKEARRRKKEMRVDVRKRREKGRKNKQ